MARRRWFVLWLCVSMGLTPTVFGQEAAPGGAAPTKQSDRSKEDETYELYKVFADTMDQVERNYVKDISRRELMEAAIKGILTKLDPHSSYISPKDLGRFKTNVESQFGGIGIQISLERGQLRVLSPLVDSPAYRAGVRTGDRILEIEGTKTDGITLDEAVRQLKGEAGTKVKLTIIHTASGEREELSIEREIIQIETVKGDHRKLDDHWDFMLDPESKIGYIRITAFSRDTAKDVTSALKDLQAEQLRGLVLDLRSNPGGLLTSAIEISDLFVSEGRIVSTEGRNSPERTWDARKPGTFEGFPMAVLVNRFSASASEIVSACLQDHKRAVVIGERSYGKGSVQNIVELEGGRSALKLTTAGYKRPNGKNIDKIEARGSDEWGVRPDDGFEVALTDDELDELFLYQRQRDLLAAPKQTSKDKPASEKPEGDKPASDKPEDKHAAFVDKQLQKALDYLKSQIAQVEKSIEK